MPIKARTRRIIQGSDYSAQEPRLLSQLCGDEGMLQAYRDGKDLYVEIASIAMHKPYKYCLEHFPKGCPIKEKDGHWYYAWLKTGTDDGKEKFEDLDYSDINPDDYDYDKLANGETDTYADGKELRGQAKRILLGIMYGRGEKSIAEQLGCDIEEAREIKNNVYTAFPKIKEFEDASNALVKSRGYVTTLWGRKRRLPNYNLPKYEFFYVDDSDNIIEDMNVDESRVEAYTKKLNDSNWSTRNKIIDELKTKQQILVVDNGSKIAAAGRQIINSRVQGSAADMSKMALIKIRNDEELNKRKVKIIIPVHDEILIETPLRYSRYVKDRFSNDMETAARPKLTIPVSCDVESSYEWYGESLELNDILKDLPIV